MAILEKEVLIKLWSKNITHFEKLGYEIPRKRSKSGWFGVPKGTKILVKVDDLVKRSDHPLTKVCDECGKHVPNQPYYAILKGREDGDGKDYCYKCSREKSRKTRIKNLKYENSLEYYAIINDKKYLLIEYSNKNKRKPDNVPYGSGLKYLWECRTCKSEFTMTAANRTSMNYNCPYCVGIKVNETNCLWSTHPHIAKLLLNPNRGYEISAGHNGKEVFICEECGFEKEMTVNNASKKGISCLCSDGISYPEKFMMSILNQMNVEYMTQKSFKWSKGKRYDFYLPHLNCIIETNGKQHYIGNDEYSIGWRGITEEQENDKYKKELATNNSIVDYIVVDCRESKMEFIKNSIMKTRLVELFNLEIISWKDCHSFAVSSLVRTACKLWNEGVKSTTEISKIIKVSSMTAGKYLKQGAELSLCDYDPKTVKTKEVIQLTKEGKFIKEWDSITEAQKKLSIDNIVGVCKGRLNSVGGFIWVYKEDYEKDGFELTKHINKNAKAIVQLTLDGAFVKEWDSVSEMQRELGINNISAVIGGRLKSAGGFIWMLKEEYQKNKENIEPVKTLSKEIIQLTIDDKIINEFPSISEASRQTGITISSLWRACKNKIPKDGFKWLYKEDYLSLKINII